MILDILWLLPGDICCVGPARASCALRSALMNSSSPQAVLDYTRIY